MLPAVLLVASSGCWGPSKSIAEPVMVVADEDEEPPPRPAPAPLPVPATAIPPAPQTHPPETASVAVAAAKPVSESTSPPTAAEAASKQTPAARRSANFAEWTSEDLLAAHEAHDVSLPQAVQHVVRTWPKNEDTVSLLVQLLHSRKDAASSTSPLSGPTVASLVIPYFAALEIADAQQALRDILRGECRTDLGEVQAVELVLRCMMQSMTPTHEAYIIGILTDPTSWRPQNAEGVTAERLHEVCLSLVRPMASASLRARLAQYIVQASAPAAHRESIGAWLAESRSENLAAHVILHNSDLLSPEHRARFRETFARLNSPALDVLLGVASALPPTPTATTPRPNVPASGLFVSADQGSGMFHSVQATDDVARAAETLQNFWTDGFLSSVARDLARMPDLSAQRELMLLAGNLPHQKVRREVHLALKRQWADGTRPFETARLTLDAFRDPGMLVLVKAMPREEKALPTTGRPAVNPQKLSRDREAKQAWMAAAESFVRSLNDRFHTAARARSRLAAAAEHPELPFALHKGLAVLAEYHLQWPAQLKGSLKNVDPLVLHYVRMEGPERFQRVSDFYRRQLASADSHAVARGQWIESQQPDSATGLLRSVDVLITREEPPPRLHTAEENLLVELLWIEIPDPTR